MKWPLRDVASRLHYKALILMTHRKPCNFCIAENGADWVHARNASWLSVALKDDILSKYDSEITFS